MLLLNVGSPAAPTAWAVYGYLRQFLMDERVLDMPLIPRWLLVNTVIAPFRASASAERYRKVWTPAGSPLVASSTELATRLSAMTGRTVEVGMAYGAPSIADAVARLRRCRSVVVVPLFPQYATATSGSVISGVQHAFADGDPIPELHIRPAFGADPAFLDVLADSARPHLSGMDHVLCSFHGLPERQITKLDPVCLTDGCCERPCDTRWSCYRAACLDTARGLEERLCTGSNLSLSLSFQSRLGRDRWLGPETVGELRRLVADGKKRVAVMCPSFVTDCLETLEEIGEEAKGEFLKAGGEELVLVPCLNVEDAWVRWLSGWVDR